MSRPRSEQIAIGIRPRQANLVLVCPSRTLRLLHDQAYGRDGVLDRPPAATRPIEWDAAVSFVPNGWLVEGFITEQRPGRPALDGLRLGKRLADPRRDQGLRT